MLLLVGAALAADVWIGGGASAGVAYEGGAIAPMATSTVSQVELDATLDADRLSAAAEIDVHIDPAAPAWDDQIPVEALWVQYTGENGYFKAGISTPDIGLEGWDDWENYLPSLSATFDGAAVGRVLGVELGKPLDEGGQVFVFGGADLDWSSPYEGAWEPTGGIGYSSEQEAWATWSGVYMRPGLEQYGLLAAIEIYPHEKVWVSVDGTASLLDTAPFVSGQLVVNILPDTLVTPVVRVEGIYDPKDAVGAGYDMSASVGARVQPVDWARVNLEGKAYVGGGTVSPAAYLTLDVFRLPSEEE